MKAYYSQGAMDRYVVYQDFRGVRTIVPNAIVIIPEADKESVDLIRSLPYLSMKNLAAAASRAVVLESEIGQLSIAEPMPEDES